MEDNSFPFFQGWNRMMPSLQSPVRQVNAHSQPQASPRRSKREHKSTLVYVDGHAVLKENNYVVKGMRYVQEDQGSSEDPKRKKQRIPQDPSKPKATVPRVVSAHETQRKQHNDKVDRMTQQNKGLRWKFLAQHKQLLSHFCEPKVLEDLELRLDAKQPAYKPLESIPTPKAVQATLRDYQQQGLTFMANMHNQNLSMILGDEMGLGKTLQTISFLCWLKETRGVTGPSLVVCPLSVLSSWCNEMSKWAPSLRYFRLHASGAEEQLNQKNEMTTNATSYDVILTTYEMAKVPTLRAFYSRIHFNYLVLDEGHKIKGHQTLIAQAVRSIHAGNKLILTGTPLQNNMVELWSLLEFLYPKIFTTSEPFAKAFDLSENVIDKVFLEYAHKLLDLIMLRRLKNKVETFIPPKLETKVYCPLSKTQTFWYRSLLMKDLGHLAQSEGQDTIASANHSVIRNLFMQLRKCCNHPFVFEGAEVDPDETCLEDLVAASGKLSVLDMLLQRLFQNDHRAVIFSQFTSVLDIIEDYCQLRGWKYCRLDGSTEPARRSYYIRRFNEPNSPFFLFLVSTRSGGMGLNLQTADTCILFDSDWNPQSDIQAMGRVHRIGQTKTVHVYRLVSSGTVEERMIQRAEKKLLLEMVNRESMDSDDEQARGLSAAELLEDIKFGSQAVFGDSANRELPSWEDIDIITDRARKESDSVGKLHGNAQHSAKEFDGTEAFQEAQNFGGTDFAAIRKQQKKELKSKIPTNLQGIGYLWHEISKLNTKRDRKNRIMMVESKGSGYGAPVPVLKSNDYDLEHGESSVFDRELKKDRKDKFAVPKKKGRVFENQDFCQVCGDGGRLLECPRCPCSVHSECVGLRRSQELSFLSCPHHRCASCSKNRASAGGLLYPCQSCANAYCEDCIPKNGDITYLDKVPRFDELGFDSAKCNSIFIICSEMCRKVAEQEHGYGSTRVIAANRKCCPGPIDVSFGFGATKTLEEELADLQEEQNAGLDRASRKLRARVARPAVEAPEPTPVLCDKYRKWRALSLSDRAIEKICLSTGNVLAVYSSLELAAKTIQKSGGALRDQLILKSPVDYMNYRWNLTNISEARQPISRIQQASAVEVIDLTEDDDSPTIPASSDIEKRNNAKAMESPPHPKTDLGTLDYWNTEETRKATKWTSPKKAPIIWNESLQYAQWEALPLSRRAIEKICPVTGRVLAVYTTLEDAAKSAGTNEETLCQILQILSPASYRNFRWKLSRSKVMDIFSPSKKVETIDLTDSPLNPSSSGVNGAPTVPEVAKASEAPAGLDGQSNEMKHAASSEACPLIQSSSQGKDANVEVVVDVPEIDCVDRALKATADMVGKSNDGKGDPTSPARDSPKTPIIEGNGPWMT